MQMGNSLGGAAMAGLGYDSQLQTGIPRMSRLPVQRRPGSPSSDGEDINDFLEVPDDGMYDDMMASDPMYDDEDEYGIAPRLMKSRFVESFGQTSAQPLQPRSAAPMAPMGGAAIRGLGY